MLSGEILSGEILLSEILSQSLPYFNDDNSCLTDIFLLPAVGQSS